MDSFTIGTPATGGAIKVYFNKEDAKEKIELAKKLYYEYVEVPKMKKALQEVKMNIIEIKKNGNYENKNLVLNNLELGQEATVKVTKLIKEGEGKYGKWYLFGFEYNGESCAGFVPTRLQEYVLNKLGQELTFYKKVYKDAKGKDRITIDIKGREDKPLVPFKFLKFTHEGEEVDEKELVKFIIQQGYKDDYDMFMKTVMQYGVTEQRAKILYENRNKAE